METKICNTCKLEKPLEEFYNDSWKKDGKRPICKECTNKKYYDCKDEQNQKHRLWLEKNRERENEKSKLREQLKKQAGVKTIGEIRPREIKLIDYKQQMREYFLKPALYDVWAHKLEKYYLCRRNPKQLEEIQIQCYYCNCWFVPTNRQCNQRTQAIVGNISGEYLFYCSNGCKKSCAVFRQSVKPRKFKQYGSSREVQVELRKLVLERDNWTCQKCGQSKHENIELILHCHHIDPVSQNPIESADIDNCITYCKECHNLVHQNTPGCAYHELRCN